MFLQLFFTCFAHPFFFSGFTFYKEAICFIIFGFSLCSNMLNLENIRAYIRQKLKRQACFKISSWDEVFTCLFFIPGWNFIPVFLTGMSSSGDEILSRQKRVNSKRHLIIDRDYFIPGRVSSRDEISRVNTLLEYLNWLKMHFPTYSKVILLTLFKNIWAQYLGACNNLMVEIYVWVRCVIISQFFSSLSRENALGRLKAIVFREIRDLIPFHTPLI